MKIIFSSLYLFLLFVFAGSCTSDKTPESSIDSLKTEATIEKKTIQTDSGRIEIEIVNGTPEGKAELIDKDGNVIARGMMNDSIPVGAWLKYDKKGNIESAQHYSNGKSLQKLDVKDFEFKEYKNEKLGVKFSVPKYWKENSSPNQALIVSFSKEEENAGLHIKPNFTVVRAKLQKGENVQTLSKLQLEMMHENFNHVVTIQENNIAVDSCFSIQRYGMYDTGQDQAGFLNVIIVANTDVWIISCEAQNNVQGEFLKYQGVFQEIVESFKRL